MNEHEVKGSLQGRYPSKRHEVHAKRQYPESEGNEADGDARQGVVVAHSTCEVGELHRRDPMEGRGHLNKEPTKGNTMGAQ